MDLSGDASLRYWNEKHLESISIAESYHELGKVAFDILRIMPIPISQVCGPISSGGEGSLEKNLKIFEETIKKLALRGENMFNQIPFEKPMQNIKEKSNLPYMETGLKLLNDFYLPIFRSGMVSRLYFIHGWESSFGARWEHDRAKELNIKINYLSKDFLNGC
jgi:hypothetical protein